MRPQVDGVPIAMWTTHVVRSGQVLELGAAVTVPAPIWPSRGGIDTPPVLGSRAVFHMAGVGGRALAKDQSLPLGAAPGPFAQHPGSSFAKRRAP